MHNLNAQIDSVRTLPASELEALRSRVEVLIPTGLGLNCEAETVAAVELVGARPVPVHLLDLLSGSHPKAMKEYPVVAFIGGFAFGDHMGAGFVFANKIRYQMLEALTAFIETGGMAFGVCNGFQTMVRLGLLPGLDNDYQTPRATLAPNERLGYRDAWVRLGFDPESPCAWTHGITTMELPARHGEGQLIFEDAALHQRMLDEHLCVARYLDHTGAPTEEWPDNPNGTKDGIAGICDPSGRLFGLMPHPDAYLYPFQHPGWHRKTARNEFVEPEGAGLRIFRNGIDAAVCIRENTHVA